MVKQADKNSKTPEEVRETLWEFAKSIDICMFTTWDGERQQSRPLSARVKKDRNAVYFLVDVTGGKNDEVIRYPHVSCGWADNGAHNYAVMIGTATVSNDRALIKELWTDFDKAWWENADDPAIRLITFTPDEGEIWDGPGRVAGFVKMMVAAVTGAAPDFGDNAKVKL